MHCEELLETIAKTKASVCKQLTGDGQGVCHWHTLAMQTLLHIYHESIRYMNLRQVDGWMNGQMDGQMDGMNLKDSLWK